MAPLTDYEKYIRTEELLSLQKTPEKMTCHDELQFQIVHEAQAAAGGRVAGDGRVPRAQLALAASDLRASAREPCGVPAVRRAHRLRPAAADVALPPPRARLSHHRHRHAVAQGHALRSARARHEDALLPAAVGRAR